MLISLAVITDCRLLSLPLPQNFTASAAIAIYGRVAVTSCDDGLVHKSTCYKIHRERVDWFTAVNRCLSYNASLAVFDDDMLTYFAASLLIQTGPLWIGLIRSWWTWPDAGYFFLLRSYVVIENVCVNLLNLAYKTCFGVIIIYII